MAARACTRPEIAIASSGNKHHACVHGHFYFITIFFKLSFFTYFFTLFKKRYGEITQEAARYPLFVIKSKGWDATAKPSVLVTGGTHGYETSGVQGALLFAEKEMVTTFSSSHHFCLAYSNVILF